MDSAAGSAEELKRHMEEAARQPEAVGEAPETEFPTEEAVPPTAAPTEESVTTTTGTKDPEEEQAEVEKESESIENGDGVDDDGGADDGGGGGGGGGWIASIATTMGFGGNASGEKATPEDDDDDDDDKSATKAKGVEADSAGGAAAGGVEEDVDAAIVDVSAVTKDGDEASVSSAKVLAEETAAPAVPAEQRDTSKGANGDGAFTEEFMERRRESIAAEMKAFLEDSDEDKGFSEREEDGDEDDEDDDGRELEVKVGGGEKGGKLNEPASDSASASAFDLTTVVGAAAVSSLVFFFMHFRSSFSFYRYLRDRHTVLFVRRRSGDGVPWLLSPRFSVFRLVHGVAQDNPCASIRIRANTTVRTLSGRNEL